MARHAAVITLIQLVVLMLAANLGLMWANQPPDPMPDVDAHVVPAAERFTLTYPPLGAEKVFILSLVALLGELLVINLVLGRLGWLPRGAAGRVALTLAYLGLFWSSLEVSLGGFVRERPQLCVPDPHLFWRLTPSLRSFPMAMVDVTTNSFGLRSPEIPLAKPPGALRVLVLGDSTLFGHAIPQHQMFAAHLQALLQRAHPDRTVQVINGAVPGYTTFQGLEYLRRNGLRFEPDWLVIGFNNDAEVDFLTDAERAPQSGFERWAMDMLYESNVYLLLRKWLINARLAGDIEKMKAMDIRPGDSQRRRTTLAGFRGNLREMVGLARERRMGVTLLVLPRNPALGVPFSIGYREVMLEMRGPAVEVLDVYRQWRNGGYAEYFLGDLLHPNARGGEMLARLVARTVRVATATGDRGVDQK